MTQQERHNAGKPGWRYLLTFPRAVEALSAVMDYGGRKYTPYNYTKGAPASQSVDSLMRHLQAWWNGEERCPESGQSHLGHLVFNALQLAQCAVTRPDLDDRPHRLLEAQQLDACPTDTDPAPQDNQVVNSVVFPGVCIVCDSWATSGSMCVRCRSV